MKTATKQPGVVLVSERMKGGIADAHGVESGSYMLCANGRQCTGDPADDLKANEQGIRMTLAKKRKSPLNPEVPFAFLGRYQRQFGCDYFLSRVNMITCKLAAFQTVKGKGDRTCLGVASDRTAIDVFGLRIGDVIVAVDYTQVRDKRHCEALLRSFQNDIVDLTVERPQTVAVPVINIKTSDSGFEKELSLSGDDDSDPFGGSLGLMEFNDRDEFPGLGVMEEIGGDPAMGVPQNVPQGVNRMLKGTNSFDLAKKIIGAKKSKRAVGKVGLNRAAIAADQPLALSSPNDDRVIRIVKQAETTKPKKGSTSPPTPAKSKKKAPAPPSKK